MDEEKNNNTNITNEIYQKVYESDKDYFFLYIHPIILYV